jgi:hypothetical protein
MKLDSRAGALVVVIPDFILRARHKDFFMPGVLYLSKTSTKPKKSHEVY